MRVSILGEVPGKSLLESGMEVLDLRANLRHLDLHLLYLGLGPGEEAVLLLELLLPRRQLLVPAGDLPFQTRKSRRADFSCSSISWRSFCVV